MDKELRDFSLRATRLAASLRAGDIAAADGLAAADLLDEAAELAGDFESRSDATGITLAAADSLLEESLNFSMPIRNDLDGRKSRLTAVQRAYADARGLNMLYPDGRSIWG